MYILAHARHTNQNETAASLYKCCCIDDALFCMRSRRCNLPSVLILLHGICFYFLLQKNSHISLQNLIYWPAHTYTTCLLQSWILAILSNNHIFDVYFKCEHRENLFNFSIGSKSALFNTKKRKHRKHIQQKRSSLWFRMKCFIQTLIKWSIFYNNFEFKIHQIKQHHTLWKCFRKKKINQHHDAKFIVESVCVNILKFQENHLFSFNFRSI